MFYFVSLQRFLHIHMTDNQIITGQYVRIEQTPAKMKLRLLAYLIDIALLVGYVLFWTYVTSSLHYSLGPTAQIIVIVLPILLYQPLCETLAGGQTLGKYLLKTRVVSTDGSQPSVGSFLLRWLLIPVDLMFAGAIAAFSMLITPRRQRIGDLAAGTMVIRLTTYNDIRVRLDEFAFVREGYQPTYTEAQQLTPEQADLIARTLADGSTSRYHRLSQLSAELHEQLQIPRQMPPRHERFLTTLLSDFRYYEMNS